MLGPIFKKCEVQLMWHEVKPSQVPQLYTRGAGNLTR